MNESPVSTEWISELLAQENQEAQAELVRDSGLLDEAGLEQLLSMAAKLLRQDPSAAGRLAYACQALAVEADIHELVPRSLYLRAQVSSISGDYDQARLLLEASRSAYEELGLWLQALRTNAGLMTVLAEVGEFQEAISVGSLALAQLKNENERQNEEDNARLEEQRLVAALIDSARGIAFGEVGEYQKSIESFDNAQAICESLGLVEQLANVLNNRGVTLRYLGHINESLGAYQQSLELIPDDSYARAITLTNIGDACLLLGNYRASLASFRDAEQLFEQLNAPIDRLSCVKHMGDTYLALNLYAEALVCYEQVADDLRQSDSVYLLGTALWGTGAAHIARAEFEFASAALEEALQIFQSIGNIPLQSAILVELASLAQAKGEQDHALVSANQALTLIGVDDIQSSNRFSGWSLQAVYAHLALADLYIQRASPDLTLAEYHLGIANQLTTTLSIPNLRYRLDQRFGHLRLLEGRFTEAQAHLEAAIEQIEQLRSTMLHESMRTSFLHDKMAAYHDLVQLYIELVTHKGEQASSEEPVDPTLVEQIFNAMEQAKSRVLVEVISGVVDAKIETSSHPETVNHLRLLQAELSAIYSELFDPSLKSTQDGDDDDHTERRIPTLQKRTAELEESITRQRLQIASQANGRDRFSKPFSLAVIQRYIPDELCILNYYVAGDEILVITTTGKQTRLFRHVGSKSRVQTLLHRLGRLMEPFQVGQRFIERHMAHLVKSGEHLLALLYKELLGELADYLSDAQFRNRSLTIIPHDLLHQVPFHALFDTEHYLLERFEISYAPNAATYALTQMKWGNPEDAILIVGISDPAIPAVETEISAIASVHKNAHVLQEERATLCALYEHLDHAPILHVACHGLFHAENPMYSALKLHNSWLTAVEIADMDLQGKLVVLSACESGRGRLLGGDENIGLTRACLGAGASTLIASLWRVQDEATAILMTEFYTRLSRGHSPVTALRKAQLATMGSHPHPYYWAPFVLLGSRN